MFDCTCRDCGYNFFMEEGYDYETDMIICPNCGQPIEETKGATEMKKIFLHVTEITEEQVNKALQCLIDNGIDEDDAYEILTALGYILLDEELFPEVL